MINRMFCLIYHKFCILMILLKLLRHNLLVIWFFRIGSDSCILIFVKEKYIWARVWWNVLCGFDCQVFCFLFSFGWWGGGCCFLSIALLHMHVYTVLVHGAGLLLYQLVFLGYLVGRLLSSLW